MSTPLFAAYLTFKEIDQMHRRPKGTAFRAFKRLSSGPLCEGEHYLYLDARTRATEIDVLRHQGRIYASTVNAVLLTEAGYALLKASLERG
ncbi:MAG: hypothetical protein H6970_06215 [Gammaproteobacteria bacterium]|nr:hypothetical protein [Gammaproteobacteria bacterium]MCP5424647.1 hypothetical protein [Gammaproteobacteria bacterium]